MAKRSVPNVGIRRAINSKITDQVRSALELAASASGLTLSAEIERRLIDSLSAESLLDALPRVIAMAVANGIRADREAQRRDVLGRATPFVVGSQHGPAMSNGAALAASTRQADADGWFDTL